MPKAKVETTDIKIKGGIVVIKAQTHGRFFFLRVYQRGTKTSKDFPTGISASERGRIKELKNLLTDAVEKHQDDFLNPAEKVEAPTLTFVQSLYDYCEFKKNTRRKVNNKGTIEYVGYEEIVKYAQVIEKYFDSKGLKNLLLIDVRPKHIEEFFRYMRNERQLTVRTCKHYSNIIRPALKRSTELEDIQKNPYPFSVLANLLARDRSEEVESECFTAPELEAFFEKAKELPIINLLKVTYLLALRPSETMGLQWKNIDFENRKILIAGNVQKKNGRFIFDEDSNKTVKSKGAFAMSDELISILKKIQNEQEQNKRDYGNCYDYTHSNYVCVNALGKMFNPQYITKNIKRLVKKMGITKKINFYSLRHTAGTLHYHQGGKDIYATMRFLRHRDIRTTMNYVHADDETDERPVDVMSKLVKITD